MATGSGAFGVKPGYNQSGGGYYYIITSLTAAQLNTVTTASSGGAATVTVTPASGADLPGGVSTLFSAGRLVKDMGRTVVSAGRTFRKVQAVFGTNANNNSSPTFGVTGPVASATNVGYASYYLETGREGANADDSLPAVVRYF